MAFPGRVNKFVVKLAMAAMLIPEATLLVPLFIYYRELHLLNTYTGVILASLSVPFLVYLFGQSSESFSSELIKASRIDGASEIKTYFRVFLPAMRDVMIAGAIIAFVNAWNSVLIPVVIIQSKELITNTIFLNALGSIWFSDYAIPRYENENWTFTELLYEAPYLKSYQDEEDEEDEEADCLEYIDNTDKIIYLYYQDDKCVGKVKLRKNWNRYAYIEDIAVCKDFRGQGIGSALINISIEWAKHKNLHGLMLETQDNNLIACKFYHNCGFKIGSVDTMLYANFENNFEKAVFWYLRF